LLPYDDQILYFEKVNSFVSNNFFRKISLLEEKWWILEYHPLLLMVKNLNFTTYFLEHNLEYMRKFVL